MACSNPAPEPTNLDSSTSTTNVHPYTDISDSEPELQSMRHEYSDLNKATQPYRYGVLSPHPRLVSSPPVFQQECDSAERLQQLRVECDRCSRFLNHAEFLRQCAQIGSGAESQLTTWDTPHQRFTNVANRTVNGRTIFPSEPDYQFHLFENRHNLFNYADRIRIIKRLCSQMAHEPKLDRIYYKGSSKGLSWEHFEAIQRYESKDIERVPPQFRPVLEELVIFYLNWFAPWKYSACNISDRGSHTTFLSLLLTFSGRFYTGAIARYNIFNWNKGNRKFKTQYYESLMERVKTGLIRNAQVHLVEKLIRSFLERIASAMNTSEFEFSECDSATGLAHPILPAPASTCISGIIEVDCQNVRSSIFHFFFHPEFRSERLEQLILKHLYDGQPPNLKVREAVWIRSANRNYNSDKDHWHGQLWHSPDDVADEGKHGVGGHQGGACLLRSYLNNFQ